mmetsp:Transcript_2433/g.4802  ORF Transcript_2433/g.4802 Transcript_2433/m.4802 type:complete len:209 (-) Transcript_2433:1177-1803(-)
MQSRAQARRFSKRDCKPSALRSLSSFSSLAAFSSSCFSNAFSAAPPAVEDTALTMLMMRFARESQPPVSRRPATRPSPSACFSKRARRSTGPDTAGAGSKGASNFLSKKSSRLRQVWMEEGAFSSSSGAKFTTGAAAAADGFPFPAAFSAEDAPATFGRFAAGTASSFLPAKYSSARAAALSSRRGPVPPCASQLAAATSASEAAGFF